ncbi:hypothetical protein PSI19_02190 [Xenorhabdus khoisanae]|uniref:hypothetical protein n=1 Tax=Xenorhabdus khoisanae TaxID=880157 RepID=UPI002359C181|nr:hypothetical protein [Xenorhabdus khoisanae]MDC9612709.1 hypothetical protein [Xenorhabdus khoisanae]
MTFLGIVSHKEHKKWQYPTPFLPYFHFYETHESKPINAPAREIIQAVKKFDISDDLFINALINIRSLPIYLLRKLSNSKKFQHHDFGLETFTILNENDHEISMGLTGWFWQANLGIIHQPDRESFMSFNDDTSAKLVLRFLIKEYPHGYRSLVTETFIFCPNKKTQNIFTLYWLAIRPASGFIRKRMLSTIVRKFKNFNRIE